MPSKSAHSCAMPSPTTTTAASPGTSRAWTTSTEAAKIVFDAVAGFGPLQQYFDDPEVEEIWINQPTGSSSPAEVSPN